MLYYLIHQSPIWYNLPNGKRNVRILFVVIALYIIIHAVSYELKENYFFFKVINGYFLWIVVADIFISSCVYRLYYGRSILKEANAMINRETELYDEKSHTYKPQKTNPVEFKDTGSNSNFKNIHTDYCLSDCSSTPIHFSSDDKNFLVEKESDTSVKSKSTDPIISNHNSANKLYLIPNYFNKENPKLDSDSVNDDKIDLVNKLKLIDNPEYDILTNLTSTDSKSIKKTNKSCLADITTLNTSTLTSTSISAT